ncbi:MAG: thioether cross-link-forming SCIFF peptide maturase [Proteocatella sp.]
MKLIHKFKQNGYNFLLDVNSGSIHMVDDVAYDVLDFYEAGLENANASLSGTYNSDDISTAYYEIKELEESGVLYTEDVFPNTDIFLNRKPVVKAMCLHMAHDCNLKCKYCFAGQGDFNGPKGLMSFEVGKKALDYLIANSGSRKNLEVDFFGGEPLLNFEVVKQLVEYGNEQADKNNKLFRFTITTNGVLLDDEKIEYINKTMHNVVLSLDGRKEVNDKMRLTLNDRGSYDVIVPKFQKLIEGRSKDKFYYIRGTFTRHNMDFGKDVLHFRDLGFDLTSMEPVVDHNENEYALKEGDIQKVNAEYERFAKDYLEIRRHDRSFKFFHFMMDLSGGPCAIKRISGCGAGLEYLAITPDGDVYPCHQFVGNEDFRLASLFDEKVEFPSEITGQFHGCNVETKVDCKSCWAKFYCSGGCHANAYNFNGSVMKPYKQGCEMQKKRIECAIMVEAALKLDEMENEN